MIAVCSSGKSFGGLADYLTEPRHGVDRVEWMSTRNLPIDDPDLVASVMQATANQNVRVEKPVYHIAVSFHPEDVVTREQMEHVADRLLDELGLKDHQALIVAHNDRPHDHFHIMVNRIDPETTRAWDRWQDYPVMQRVMREQEQELGVHQVRSTLEHDLHQLPEQSPVASVEQDKVMHVEAEPLLDRIQAHVAELRAAESWKEFEATLDKCGLSAERKGQGLVFTDGETEVKASSVHRELSFGKLEQRLGAYDVAHESLGANHEGSSTRQQLTTHDGTVRESSVGDRDRAPSPLHLANTPDLAHKAADIVRDLSQIKAIERGIERTQEAESTDRAHLQQLERAVERARDTSDQFNDALGEVYARADEARERFDRTVKSEGIEHAARRLEHQPEAFGALHPTEHKALFGLVTRVEYDTARRHAGAAAARGYEAYQADGQRQTRVGDIGHQIGAGPVDYAHTIEHLGDRIQTAERQLENLVTMREALPSRGELVRELRDTIQAFGRVDLNRFAGQVTQLQLAFAMRVANAAKDVLLGREEGLGR